MNSVFLVQGNWVIMMLSIYILALTLYHGVVHCGIFKTQRKIVEVIKGLQ